MVLTAWASHVHALDRSSVMLEQVRGRCPESLNLMWLESDLLDPAVPLRDAGYDAMTAVSSLHHMPLQAALARLTGLLCPGGVLVVVGHYRPATVAIVPWT